MIEKDVEKQLLQWNLFKEYGQFNLHFEAIVTSFRELLIDLVKRYYGFEVDWEDDKTDDLLPPNLQDRLLKIILHDDGAMAIIEKCRSCLMDITSAEVIDTLQMNNVKPIEISDFDKVFANNLFKKAFELVKLRNNLIHSHFEGNLYDLFPITELKGVKDKKVATGYRQDVYEFNTKYLEKLNDHLEQFDFYVKRLKYQIFLSDGEDSFTEIDIKVMSKLSFVYKLLN